MKDPLEQRAQLYTDRAGELRPAGSPLRGADDFLADMCFAPNHPVDAALPLRRIIRLPLCTLVLRDRLASKPLPDDKSKYDDDEPFTEIVSGLFYFMEELRNAMSTF